VASLTKIRRGNQNLYNKRSDASKNRKYSLVQNLHKQCGIKGGNFMKCYWKMIWCGYLSMVLFLGSFLTVMAAAQTPSGVKGPDAVGKDMRPGWEPDPAKMIEKRLGLSKEQSAKIKELFRKHLEEGKLLFDQLQIDRATLQLKVDSKATEEEIKVLLDALAEDRKNLEAHRQQFEDQLRAFLSSTQQALLVLDMTGGPLEGPWVNPWKDNIKGNVPQPPPTAQDPGFQGGH
jgi:hypothetical protein